MHGYIYLITNTVNNKKYVGKTMSSIEERFKQHLNDSTKRNKENRPLYRAMKKYGKENFTVEMLEKVKISDGGKELEEKEIYWINKLNTYHNGYNATLGGDGTVLYDYSKIIDIYKRTKNMNETCRIVGCDNQTVRNILRIAGITKEETRKNFLNSIQKEVTGVNKKTNEKIVLKNLDEVAEYVKSKMNIESNLETIKKRVRDVVSGRRKSAYGYIWNY